MDAFDADASARRARALSRVRKLLRLAEDQDGTPEGRSALARAEELLARHGLARATLGTSLDREDDGFGLRRFTVGQHQAWRQSLVHAVADHLDCVALHRKGSDEVETYGPRHALPQLEYVFIVYLRGLRDAWTRHTESLQAADLWSVLSRRQQLDARESFCVSYVIGVQRRLEEERKAERKQDPASWRDSVERRKDLERWIRHSGVRWRSSGNGAVPFSDEGYQAGLETQVDSALRGRGPKRLTG